MNQISFGWSIPPLERNGRMANEVAREIFDHLDEIQDGFDSVWVTDHLMGQADNPDIYKFECWTLLTTLAQAYPALDLGTLVLCQSYRNPALLAKMAATLQSLTQSRVYLGIGAGWQENEYDAYDFEYSSASQRIAELGEAVQIIRKLWTEKEANFDGKFYQVRGAYCEPKPSPLPPIMIGGGGEKLLLRVVAEQADWWNMVVTDLETTAHKCNVLREHCLTVGRDYDEIVKTWCGTVAIAETEEEAQRIAEASPLYKLGWIKLIGTPSQLVDQLHQYVILGVSYFMVLFADYPNVESAKLFATDVIPHFKA